MLIGRKAMTNLYSVLQSRDITLPTKVCLVKAMVFPVVMYGCESWTIKKAEHQRIDAFELWGWRRLESPFDCKEIKSFSFGWFYSVSFLYSRTLTSIHDQWKTIVLTIKTLVSKVMFLLFNTLYRFVIAFLPRSWCFLISWLQSPSAVILEPRK